MKKSGKIKKKNLHVDSALTNISTAYIQSEDAFIANRVFGELGVDKRSNVFWKYPKGYWTRGGAKLRAPHTQSAGNDFDRVLDNYFCKVWAFHKDIAEQDREAADSMLQLDRDAVEFVTRNLLIAREKQFAETFLKAGVWGTTNTTVTSWSDYAASKPLQNVLEAKNHVLVNTGIKPNVMVVGAEVHTNLMLHPDLTSRMSDSTDRIAQRAIIANYFQVEDYFVSEAIHNVAPEEAGQDAFEGAFVMGQHALLAYRPPRPSLMTPTSALVFKWNAFSGAGKAGARIKRFDIDVQADERVEGEMAHDMKLVGADLGYLFADIL